MKELYGTNGRQPSKLKIKENKEEEAKLKRINDEAKKKNKVIVKFKPLPERSEPRKIKKKIETNHKLNKEDEDKLYYVGFI